MAGEETPPPSYSASERYGPLVHRSVHHGAILLVLGSVALIAGMVITQIGYGPSYSLQNNYISDFGAVSCGNVTGTGAFGGGGHYVCSPWHLVFNVSIILSGILLVGAALLLPTAFPARRSRTIGLGLFVIAGIGTAGVGIFPEDVNIVAHVTSASAGFLAGSLALIVLGFAMFRDTRWNGYRAYSVVSGLVSLTALVLFIEKTYLGLGVGGMERLIVAPILLWAIVVGVHLARIPTFAPRTIPKPSGE